MKKCIICNSVKELTEFYTHKQMGDGRLNKCKECCKTQSKAREEKLRLDPDWVEKEKKRGRDKYHRLGYKDNHKPTIEKRDEFIKKYKEKYPEKVVARNRSSHLKPLVKGNHLHHWNYNIEHVKDVIELSPSDHYKLHRYIIYDPERFMFRRCDNNELLDSKELHVEFFNLIKNKP